MATVLDEQKTTSKSEAYLRRKFAELCARIKRVDLLTHFLVLALTILTYAAIVGVFDFTIGNVTGWTDLSRWFACAVFLGIFGFALIRAIQCWLHRINPYYVAHQLEQSMPDAKNSLINWLDLYDEGIPSAFQKTLSARAAERLEEADVDQTVPTRKNWVLLGVLGMPALGLLILLILGPSAFFASMLRAFVPFYTPAPIARTQLTLLQPQGGDAEIGPGQSVAFTVRIEGRLPRANRPGAPTLSYRYQASEDYLTKPLEPEGDGLWTVQLHASQVRTGFTYKISAGDAETPEHRVRVRGPAHVKKYELTYHHRPYRNLKQTTITFPNDRDTRPTIRGPRGSDVELVIRASRPVKKATVEIMTAGVKTELPLGNRDDDAFTGRWMLDRPGQFRVVYTATDGEENSDRTWHPIDVLTDDAPHVVLTVPGKDVKLPCNDVLELEGEAASTIGLKSLTLHFRVVDNPVNLLPQSYRPDASLKLDDGFYPDRVEYSDFVLLDKLRVAAKTVHLFDPGTILEYWLEAIDCTDYPNPNGNAGKSPVYKVTLTAPLEPKSQQKKIDKADKRRKDQAAKQEADRTKKNNGPNEGSGSQPQDPQQSLDQINKEKQEAEDKIKKAMDEEKQQKDKGSTKSGERQNSASKSGPDNAPDSPDAKNKESPSMSPGDSGNAKDKGDGKDSAGTPKDQGDQKKNDGSGEPPLQGSAKGVEKNGPETKNKDAGADMNPQPPEAANKGGMMTDAGEPKKGPPDQEGGTGQARADQPKANPAKDDWNDLARNLEKLQKGGDDADKAGAALAEIASQSDDPRKRDLAGEILKSNGRNPKTGKEEKKGPNQTGTLGKSMGIGDDVKAAVANRDFAARIGQMQLDDWRKRMTPNLLKKAGMTDADWQRYLKNMQAHDAAVRALNAKMIRDALKQELRGGANPNTGVRAIETTGNGADALDPGRASAPPELRDALRILESRREKSQDTQK